MYFDRYECFGGSYCLCYQGGRVNENEDHRFFSYDDMSLLDYMVSSEDHVPDFTAMRT
jgi:hypothetical protein